MVAYVFYSHYDYSDIWPLMFGQSEKFLKNKKKYLITNKICDFDVKDWNVILYNDEHKYQQRVYESLEKIEEEIIIFHHEDMFLLSEPNWEQIENLIHIVRKDEMNIIKLIKASYNNSPEQKTKNPNLFYNSNNLLFSIQPSIIKRQSLINIYKHTMGSSIWEFEMNSNNLVEFMKYSSCYYFEGTEKKRGLYHWDSTIYPYIATAVVKGKWDFQCYQEELKSILNEYKIDKNIRGTNV